MDKINNNQDHQIKYNQNDLNQLIDLIKRSMDHLKKINDNQDNKNLDFDFIDYQDRFNHLFDQFNDHLYKINDLIFLIDDLYQNIKKDQLSGDIFDNLEDIKYQISKYIDNPDLLDKLDYDDILDLSDQSRFFNDFISMIL